MWLLVRARYYLINDVIAAIEEWCNAQKLNPKATYIWMDALCLNQHRIVKELTPEEVAQEFGPRVEAIGCILPMFHPWDNPLYTSRAWCLFELFTAIQNRATVDIEVILTPEQGKALHDSLANEGYAALDAALSSIRAEDASATVAADLDAIKAVV